MMQFTQSEFYLNKKIATSFTVAFSILFLLILITTIYSWVPGQQNSDSNIISVIHVPHPTYHLQDISSWHLMGGNPSVGDLPETNLQLTLQGVLTMPDAARSTAIIAQPNQAGRVYRPGDVLPGGAILDRVMSDRIIIQNRGKLEVLSLVRAKLQFAPPPPSIWS